MCSHRDSYSFPAHAVSYLCKKNKTKQNILLKTVVFTCTALQLLGQMLGSLLRQSSPWGQWILPEGEHHISGQ